MLIVWCRCLGGKDDSISRMRHDIYSCYIIYIFILLEFIDIYDIHVLRIGTNGIDIYHKDGKLFAEARVGEQEWRVESADNFLVEGHWNNIYVAWSPIKGLLLAKQARLYLLAEDIGSQLGNEVNLCLGVCA